MTAVAVAEHMAAVILGSLAATYLIAAFLVLVRPSGWRLLTWLSQIAGFSATCFLMGRLGLMKPPGDAAVLAVAGAGVGALAAWRWTSIAQWLRQRERTRRQRRRLAARSV